MIRIIGTVCILVFLAYIGYVTWLVINDEKDDDE